MDTCTTVNCMATRARFSQTCKVGYTNAAVALSVGNSPIYRKKKTCTHKDVLPAHRKMSSVFKGFFFSKGCVSCSVLDLLNEV